MFNKEQYRASKPAVKRFYEKHGFSEMPVFSALAFVPILVVYEFLMEDYPEIEEQCKERIKGIKDFFGYKD